MVQLSCRIKKYLENNTAKESVKCTNADICQKFQVSIPSGLGSPAEESQDPAQGTVHQVVPNN